RGDGLRLGIRFLDQLGTYLSPVLRQLAEHAALELGGEFRIRLGVSLVAVFPFLLECGAAAAAVPRLVHRLRNFEGRVIPADVRARGGNFVGAERRAVRVGGVRLVRGALADDGLAADDAGP